ncbi:MAG: diaminobutyrate--2-oxoglutarate transaminase [Acidimicrobiia bacterium]
MNTVNRLESEVRAYCRAWPTDFAVARGCRLTDVNGRRYLDLFAGAGSLNYGHNHPVLKAALIEYLAADGIVHSLDMATVAKERFLDTFDRLILRPRGLRYKVQFPGPTGTNSVEAALKLARKVTGRDRIVSFTNSFHGMTLGSLSVTGNSIKRNGAGLPLGSTVSMPFDGYLGEGVDTLDLFESMVDDAGSGFDRPAAAIVETVQAEGGINVASMGWLRRLADVCRRHEMLLIIDDIQVGNGRTGSFFSFEPAEVVPDIVCLSKSLSGYGLPLAVTLIRPELDIWAPGEHNGTFRGHNPAFVTATAALDTFWTSAALAKDVARKGGRIEAGLEQLVQAYPELHGEVRGRGMLQGIVCDPPALAGKVTRAAFDRNVIIETSGIEGQTIKMLPPLVIDHEDLDEGLSVLDLSIADALGVAPRADLEELAGV